MRAQREQINLFLRLMQSFFEHKYIPLADKIAIKIMREKIEYNICN